MDRKDFYFLQPVTESELNGAFDEIEVALWRLVTDFGLFGIASGMVGGPTSTPSLSVTISGPSIAYDQAGNRISVPSPGETIDLTSAPIPGGSSFLPTAVAAAGNEKWIAVFIKFARVPGDPRVDGSSNTIYFQANEGHQYVVQQGPEVLTGTLPRAQVLNDPTMVRLFDVKRVFGRSTILVGDIDTTLRQDTFDLVDSTGSFTIRAGGVRGGITALLAALSSHVGGAGKHVDTDVTSIARGGSPLALPAGSVGSQLDAIRGYIDGTLAAQIAALTGTVGGLAFADTAISSPVRAGTPLALPGTTVGAQLDAIRAYIDGGLQTALAALTATTGFTKRSGRLVMTNPQGTTAADCTGVFAGGTWQSFVALSAFTASGASYGSLSAVATGAAGPFSLLGVAGFNVLDLIEVSFEGNIVFNTSTTPGVPAQNMFGLWYQFAAPSDPAPTSLSSMTLAPESTRYVIQMAGLRNADLVVRSTLFLPQMVTGGATVLYVAPAIIPANSDASGFAGLIHGCHWVFQANRLTGVAQ